MSEEAPGWNEYHRRDGMRIAIRNGYWRIVLSTDQDAAVQTCPCCGQPFSTARAAKRVCNFVYPLPEAQV